MTAATSKRIALIQGHPDPGGGRFCHALAFAYAEGAREAGHEVRAIDVAKLEFPLLRTSKDWQEGTASAAIAGAQQTIAWAQHLVIVFPLWLGEMAALLKAFFEQVLRPGFAIDKAGQGGMWKKLLTGKSARIVVTMGMPAFFYRLYFRAHSIKNLERNILSFCGIRPVHTTLIGTIESRRQRCARRSATGRG